MLNLVEQRLDHLLGLDAPASDPDDHVVFGHARAPRLELLGVGGQRIDLVDACIIGFHRCDDQSQARSGGMDLEFQTEAGDLVVDLDEFVEQRLLKLVSGWNNLVLALCNPDRLALSASFRPLLKELRGPLYWADGVVQASYEHERGPRGLEALRWYREA